MSFNFKYQNQNLLLMEHVILMCYRLPVIMVLFMIINYDLTVETTFFISFSSVIPNLLTMVITKSRCKWSYDCYCHLWYDWQLVAVSAASVIFLLMTRPPNIMICWYLFKFFGWKFYTYSVCVVTIQNDSSDCATISWV